MIGRADKAVAAHTLWLTGYERSNLGPELARRGARIVADPHPDQNFFERSDNIMLARQGVVAQTVSSYGMHTDYHQPSDDLAHLDIAAHDRVDSVDAEAGAVAGEQPLQAGVAARQATLGKRRARRRTSAESWRTSCTGIRGGTMQGVSRVPILFVNAYLVDVEPDNPSGGWVLVDSGLPGVGVPIIERAAAARYGARPPRAIVLTHGHFDHAGSAARLAAAWQVPILAHELERPYLTGRSDYPPPDPTVGGALALLSRTFPYGSIDLGERLRSIDADGALDPLPGWRAVHTPGHTAGHVSLFRESDGTLLAGDALTTVNQESWVSTMTMKPELRWPPAPLTTDWTAANASVHRLAALGPRAIAAGHGRPMVGDDATRAMEHFAAHFSPPREGRYVRRPARTDEHGVVFLPPPVADPVGGAIRGAAIAAAVTGVVLSVSRAHQRRRRAVLR